MEKKSCKNPFLAILRLKNKKFRWPLSSRGGGKALMAWPLVEEFFFCGFPYIHMYIKDFILQTRNHVEMIVLEISGCEEKIL